MTASLSRRHFVQQTLAASLGFAGLQALAGCKKDNADYRTRVVPGTVGALQKDPAGILDLPKGFRYTILSRQGEKMSDGLKVPGYPDGMAAFPGKGGKVIVVRNHEVPALFWTSAGAFGEQLELLHKIQREDLYDAAVQGAPALGGTTTFVYDPKTQKLDTQYLSLAGTLRNCAGGPTPWNSWLSCEETVQSSNSRWKQDHGYVFEVPASETIARVKPVPLKEMGRFMHEAVAVDHRTGIVYETEDRKDGLLYRFLPSVRGKLQQGGELQALCIRGQKTADTRNWSSKPDFVPGTSYAVEWVPLKGVDTAQDDLRKRGALAGAARFARGEGMWFGRGQVFFACTTGGVARKGQIWAYKPSPFEGSGREKESPGTLELLVEPNNSSIVENADNLTVAPWGDLIVCEDGPGHDYLLGVTPKGKVYNVARNSLSSAELTGACFSPDGKALFVNLQQSGLTLAITGPWPSSRTM